MIYIAVQTEDIDSVKLQQALHAPNNARGAVGAVVTFTGVMRDLNDVNGETAQVNTLTLEHYPGMTEASLHEIAVLAQQRFNLLGVSIVHRVGTFKPTDAIVWVGVSSSHRQASFDGCAFVMDFLKTQAPFWKKEHTSQGARWVDARDSDTAAAQRWQ